MIRLAALAWRNLWARPLAAMLNLTLMALGVAAMSFLLLVTGQLQQSVQRDLAGIDLVVGAKGSPLQLILAGVFHLDVPTGNIPLASAEALRRQPLVDSVVPLALGDSVQGHRIVGTETAYLQLYGAGLAQGRLWSKPLEAVLGHQTARSLGLAPGGQFVGSHGLAAAGDSHGDSPYSVVGVLARCGCVLDRLALTSVESVWAVHEHAEAGNSAVHAQQEEEERELTLLLVRYRSPLGAVTLPRWVNAQDGLQAAVPALESARLLRMVGVGTEVLSGFALLLLVVAGLSTFIALYHAVVEREADLAMMRMLGATPARLAVLIGMEALILAALGLAIGLGAGHALAHALGWMLERDRSLPITGAMLAPGEIWLVLGGLLMALLAAALPATRALRLDVTQLLQAPR